MTPKEVVQAGFDAWNRRDRDAFRSLVSDDFQFEGEPAGPDGWLAVMDVWAKAFPDNRMEIASMIGDEEGVACEATFTGTQTGSLEDQQNPPLPPTGKRVTIHFATYQRVLNEKLVSFAGYGVMGSLIEAGVGGLQATVNGVPVNIHAQPSYPGTGLHQRAVAGKP